MFSPASPCGTMCVCNRVCNRVYVWPVGTDKLILGEILQDAENASPSGSLYGAALLDVLRSYDTVLLRHGIAPGDDTLYYRTLLKLSMNTGEPDWWRRLDAEIKVCCVAVVVCPPAVW